MKFSHFLPFFCLCFGLLNVPAAMAQRPYPQGKSEDCLITHAQIHCGNGNFIPDGFVWVKSGKIHLTGAMKDLPAAEAGTKVHDAGKAHLYPGFFACNSTLGLTEIEAVRATNDFAEPGYVNPDVKTCFAFYTDSKVIPTVRQNGVLICQATPRGGLFSGTSSMMRLDAWNYEDAAITCADGIHLNWPELPATVPSVKNEKDEWVKREQEYQKSMNDISTWLMRAKTYKPEKDKLPDLRLAALAELFSGNKRLYLHVGNERSIRDAVYLAVSCGVAHPVLVDAWEFPHCIDLIKKHNLPLMLPRVHSLPPGEDFPSDYFMRLPVIAYQNKLLFCLQNQGDMEAMHARNIPFLAGSTLAYEMPYEQAVAAITGNAALITGIDAQYGTIENGKSATFFLSSGDALEITGNRITHAFIDGRPLQLENLQENLYKVYKEKYGLNKP